MLKDQKIVVTGATSGLGRELSLQLSVHHGAEIIATGRRENLLDDLVKDAKAQGGHITARPLDHLDPIALDAFIAELNASSIDGIILNAGITFAGGFERADISHYEDLIGTNVTSNIRLISGLTNMLSAANGHIYIIASMAGLVPVPYQSVYAGSKAFMVNFGLSLREEYKHKNITVGIFTPGGIATEMTEIKEFESLRNALAPARDVAKSAILGYINQKAVSAPGLGNKSLALASRILPKRFLAKQAEKIYRSVRDAEVSKNKD